VELQKVEIENFRSIDKLAIPFAYRCQALIGINESGKSNILRALHLLDPTTPVAAADLRIERHDEAQVTAGHVRFVFTLSEDEKAQVFHALEAQFCAASLGEKLLASGGKRFTLAELVSSRGEGLYLVALPSGTRNASAWSFGDQAQTVSGWHRSKAAEAITFATGDDGLAVTVPARGFVFLPQEIAASEPRLEALQPKVLERVFVAAISQVVTENLPACIFWRYADKYLLPSSVDVAAFCANPDSCVPLKSIFELAGYSASELGGLITKAQQQGHYRYLQILQKASSAATDHIRQVWKDYKTVQIRLEANGPTVAPVVVDEMVPLDMANRSDGFKRFISFLLQISAKVRTEEIENTLILVDEPEIALHPSGARNLMKELIEISKSNVVVYSTHSIFMIDKSQIGRHVVVEKSKEVTKTWRAEKSRIQDEEVLYSAMGYSIFESLKQYNVVFEGWRDKEIFRVASEALGKSNRTIKEQLSEIGVTFAEGVKDVRHVTQFLQLAARPCLIISDADKVALQHRKLYQVPGAWGVWKTLQDAIPETSVVTAEDLLKREAVIRRANKFAEAQSLGVPLKEDFFGDGEATLVGLKRWLVAAGLKGDALEEGTARLKESLFEGLKRSDLSDQVDVLVAFVAGYSFQ
jgi:hypothetical protein